VCALALGIAAAGCGGTNGARGVNVSGGEYYSQEEQAALSASERSAYCDGLAKVLAAAQQEFEQKQKDIQATKTQTQAIRQQITPIEQQVVGLESSIRSMEAKIAAVKALPQVYKVRPGDSLSLIAMNKEIYNDIEKWWRIFEANRSKVEDPYYIFPDTTLVIPRDWPAE
jgi:nucleoid-associated protein YgaU